MQLGFVSAILGDLPLAEVFRTAADLGYDCVELMCWPPSQAERRYAGVTHLNVVDFGPSQVAELRQLTTATGVSVSGLGYYPNPLAADAGDAAKAVDHIGRVIEATAQLGLGVMNTFIGRDPSRSVADQWPRFLETWRPLVAKAESLGVRIGIENCPMLFTKDEWPGGKNLATSPAVWRRMFAEIPSQNFGLNFDPSHFIWQFLDTEKALRDFAARLVHVHAKDARIDYAKLGEVGILATPNEYHQPKLPGLGDVDWGRFFSTLNDVGYRGPVCVEVEDRAYEHSLETRLGALQQSAQYLRNFIPKRRPKA